MPVAVRGLRGPAGHAPPLLILQTTQPVNWRPTDTAEESHEDNVRVASVTVIPLRCEECPSVAAVHADLTSHHGGFAVSLTVRPAAVFLCRLSLSQTNTREREFNESCEISHVPPSAADGR